MVILTVIRRLLIFVIAICLLFNSVLLVLAKTARDGKTPQADTYKVKAYFASRELAKSRAGELKLEEGRYRIYDVTRERREKTGDWNVEMVFAKTPADQVEVMATTLTGQGFPNSVESSEDGSRTIRLRQAFSSKRAADAKVTEVLSRSNGLFMMSSEPGTRKVSFKAWCLEVAVSDDETMKSLKQKLKGKATLEVR
ncbi:MAG: hypothetical protein FJX76_03195 [Armatimonadetes bacterium]|nr:hypothetical protein [Armatimonadota bacterium]